MANTFKVKNCPNYMNNYKFAVIRDCENAFWFYSCYNDVTIASRVAKEIGNGVVVLTEDIIESF